MKDMKKQTSTESPRQTDYEHFALATIISATRHHDSIRLLDHRVFLVTLTLTSSQGFKKHDDIYYAICKFLRTKDGNFKDRNRPGLVLTEETGGERNGKSTGKTPHWHGILILSEHHAKLLRGDYDLEKDLDVFLEQNLNFVKQSDLRKYEIGKQSLPYLADYSAKGLKSKKTPIVQESNQKFLEIHIYPHDLDKIRLRKSKVNKLEARFDDRLATYERSPSAFFSEAYIEKYLNKTLEPQKVHYLPLKKTQLVDPPREQGMKRCA